MRALRASASIALTIVACQALAVAQTSAPAAGAPPSTAAPPSYPPPPGAQPPPANDPPPPGYQQPPPGYQQQPPPGYQQPPPGYQPPPPGYQPPPGYYQPPPPLRPPPRTHGFLALPFIGVATFAGQSGNLYHPGATLGALVGGRLNPSFSINGELRMDAVNFRNVPVGEKWEAFEFDFALSPLFHVPFVTGEMVIGPKLGFAGYDETDTANGLETFRQHWSGFSAGFNAGVFFAVSRVMSLGGMLSFTVRDPNEVCGTPAGGRETCTTTDYQSEKVFGFQAGALF